MIAVLKHELRNYFNSLTAYVLEPSYWPCRIGSMLYNLRRQLVILNMFLALVV